MPVSEDQVLINYSLAMRLVKKCSHLCLFHYSSKCLFAPNICISCKLVMRHAPTVFVSVGLKYINICVSTVVWWRAFGSFVFQHPAAVCQSKKTPAENSQRAESVIGVSLPSVQELF